MAGKVGQEDNKTLLKQIECVDKQLERCQLKCDELEKQNKVLTAQYDALETDKKDIAEYLKYSMADEDRKVEQLLERMKSQQQAAKQDREAMKLQHCQQTQELQKQIGELTSESMKQAARFEEQQELHQRLLQQQYDMESLEKQLVSQIEELKTTLFSLEKEAELERIKMMNAAKADIEMKTSSILQEERAQNSKRLEQIQVLLNEIMKLWDEINGMRAQESSVQTMMKALQTDISEIAQRKCMHQKDGERLLKVCQHQEEKLKQHRISHQHMLTTEEELRQQLSSESEESRQKTAKVEELKAELQEEQSRRGQLEGDMQKAVIILRHMLTDSLKVSKTQCKRLLEILESVSSEGKDSILNESNESSSQSPKPQSTEPKLARAVESATDPLFLMARYRLGDLGLVPPPTWIHKPVVSRMDSCSTCTQLPLNRKVCAHETTSSSPPADPQVVREKDEYVPAHCSVSK